MQTEIRKLDTRKYVDNLHSPLHNSVVIRVSDITRALEQRLKADLSELRDIRKEQDKLRKEWMRYSDLDVQAKRTEERLRRTVGILGDDAMGDIEDAEESDLVRSFVISLTDLTLWEVILGVLEQNGEIQIYELQHVLEQLGKKVSRQAIESAIATHKELFSIRTRGRDKFVSLRR